jgi:hypothetical protein
MRRCGFWLALILLIGCGQGNDAGLVPVTGSVRWQAKAVAGAELNFIPIGDTLGVGGTGRTDEKGGYELKYGRGGKGVLPGTYKVVISYRVLPDGSPVPENYQVGTHDSNARETLPVHYSDQEQTKLQATVPAGGGPVDFNLP